MKVPEVARLNESTVQAVARGDVKPRAKRHGNRRKPADGSTQATGFRVDPRILAWLKANVDDMRRVEFRSMGEVIVHNNRVR